MSAGDTSDLWNSPAAVASIARLIREIEIDRKVALMHVCGTHEHSISRAGIRSIVPENVRLIAGPGCPVCVCPSTDVDLAIAASKRYDAIIATFGDMMRVPAVRGSLEIARAEGADVRVVYSPKDAVELARANRGRKVVFIAVGFETTAAPIAAALLGDPPDNFFIIPSLRLIPPALEFLLQRYSSVDGFILPGHVSAIIGRKGYLFLESRYGIPAAIAGFEALDVMQAIRELLLQIRNRCRGNVVNVYKRVVREEGNHKALAAIYLVFEPGDSVWRGIGKIPGSGLVLREDFSRFDAAKVLGLEKQAEEKNFPEGCECSGVIVGEVEPEDCRFFGNKCTPANPFGPCMVSSEGTCKARYVYRRVERQA